MDVSFAFCLFLVVSHFLAASCLAGGWTQPEGNFYGRVAFNYYTADENFESGGSWIDFSNNGDFSDMNACLYMEYGLTPTLTLISNLTYKYLIEAGYRFRGEEPADEVRYLAELGIDFTKNSYRRVKLDRILGVGNEGPKRDAAGNPSTTDDFDLGKLDICLGCNLSDTFGIEVGYTPDKTAAGKC
ncbi:MAG: hypothetical protein V2B19_05245 [Pseudomonadota bacterium]